MKTVFVITITPAKLPVTAGGRPLVEPEPYVLEFDEGEEWGEFQNALDYMADRAADGLLGLPELPPAAWNIRVEAERR